MMVNEFDKKSKLQLSFMDDKSAGNKQMRKRTYFRIQGFNNIFWNWIWTELIWDKISKDTFDQSWTKYWANLATASSQIRMEKMDF